MRPITPAEREAWAFYLTLHRGYWQSARAMFRRACQGDDQASNLLQFVSETGLDDAAVIIHLEQVLRDLAAELAPGRPPKVT